MSNSEKLIANAAALINTVLLEYPPANGTGRQLVEAIVDAVAARIAEQKPAQQEVGKVPLGLPLGLPRKDRK
jgi:hypothetical protein